ncbi:MAG: response regulator transcription factor [Pseudomonadota bacterium]
MIAGPSTACNANTAESSTPCATTRPIRVLIADDHRLVLEGLRSCLEVHDAIEIVAVATDAEAAIALTGEHEPDVALIDINMPGMTGLEAARVIMAATPSVRILIVSMHDNPEYITAALALGARGYVLKDVSAREMVAAIEAVHGGGTYLSTTVSERLEAHRLPARRRARSARGDALPLSAREQLVLVLLSEGKSNKEVAAELAISVRTVETHRKNLKRKLDIATTAGLTRYVLENGLTRAAG